MRIVDNERAITVWGMPKGTSIRLLVGYVLCFATLLFLYHRLPSQVSAAPDLPLLGSILRARPGTDFYVLQAVVIMSIMGTIALAAKLTRETYVRHWTGVWLSLFLYYCYKSITGVPVLSEMPIIEGVLFALSTIFILLTGLHLPTSRSKEREAVRDLQVILALTIFFLFHWLVARAMGVSSLNTLTAATGSLACVATIFTGSRLYHYAPVPRGFIGGKEVKVVFALYGLLQLAAPWLAINAFRFAFYTLALALKIPCSLSVVAIALRSASKTSQEAQEQLRAANEELQSSQIELRKALILSQDTQRSGELRQQAQRLFGSVITKSTRLPEALQLILRQGLDFLGSTKGLLYLYQPSALGTQPLWNLAAFVGIELTEEIVQIRAAMADPTPTEPVLGPQRFNFGPVFTKLFSGRVLCLTLNKDLPEDVGWIVSDLPSDIDDLDLRLSILEELLGKFIISIELVHSREVLALLESFTKTDSYELDKGQELDKQLLKIPRLLLQAIDAQEVILDLANDRTEDHYYCRWPATAVTFSQSSRNAEDTMARSPYPRITVVDRIMEDEVGSWVSMIRVPLRGLQDPPVGIIRCKGKRAEGKEALGLAFDHYDVRKVEAIAEMASAAILRSRKYRNIEVLVARHVHELRNPVGSLRNIVHWVQRELVRLAVTSDEKIWTKMKDAELDVETLRQLTDLVDIFRGGAHEKSTPTRIFGDIILKAVPELRHRLHRLGIEKGHIQIDIEDINLIPTLILPRSHANQIIINLIDNALKYRKTSPGEKFRIQFRGDVDTRFYKIRVSDWGIGIPAGWEERIFGDGVRAPNAIKLSAGGMGVGLHVARDLAARLGGRLTLASRERPTEFIWELPKGLRDDSVHG